MRVGWKCDQNRSILRYSVGVSFLELLDQLLDGVIDQDGQL